MRTGIIISLLFMTSCMVMTEHTLIYPYQKFEDNDCRKVVNTYTNKMLINTDPLPCYSDGECYPCIELHPVIVKTGDTTRWGPDKSFKLINR